MPDVYVTYLHAYLAHITGRPIAEPGDDASQVQAACLAAEDASIVLQNRVNSKGYRERWAVLELIEAGDAAERPSEEEDEDDDE